MPKAALFAGAVLWLAALSPAHAGGWSVGVGFGGPVYYGPPPVYYGPPPAYVYEQPPVVYAPAPAPVVRSSLAPAAVFDALERAGYGGFGPMAFREGVYKLNATNRRGDLVALEVSALDGTVESELLLKRGRVSKVRPAAPRPAQPQWETSETNPLVVY